MCDSCGGFGVAEDPAVILDERLPSGWKVIEDGLMRFHRCGECDQRRGEREEVKDEQEQQ